MYDYCRAIKAALQEWAEAKGRGLPRYSVLDESGPDHQRSYTFAERVSDADARATAGTKREPETFQHRRDTGRS